MTIRDMYTRKVITGVLFFYLLGFKVGAQQVPLYSQYVLNNFLINPAIAGSEGYGSLSLVAREQWIGMEGAPSTYAMSFHSRVTHDWHQRRKPPLRLRQKYGFTTGKVGFGGYVFHDQAGALGRTGLRASYAYHLYNKSNGHQLSFGLSLVGYQLKFDESKVNLRDEDDEVWMEAKEPVFIPDADFGIYYSTPRFFVGFSADQLLESVIKFGNEGFDEFRLERNYYLMGGYDFVLDRQLLLTPSTLLKLAENGTFQGDFGLKLHYDQKYWGEVSYRTGSAIILKAGLSVDRYVFGYAFDISLSNIMKHSYGSHEFIFALKLGSTQGKYRYMSR